MGKTKTFLISLGIALVIWRLLSVVAEAAVKLSPMRFLHGGVAGFVVPLVVFALAVGGFYLSMEVLDRKTVRSWQVVLALLIGLCPLQFSIQVAHLPEEETERPMGAALPPAHELSCLVIRDELVQSGWTLLSDATQPGLVVGVEPTSQGFCLRLSPEGQELMHTITSEHVGDMLGLAVDGKLCAFGKIVEPLPKKNDCIIMSMPRAISAR